MTTVSYRQRVLRQSRAVKLICLLPALALTACAHPVDASKTPPATAVSTPGRGAVTFEYLQHAPVPSSAAASTASSESERWMIQT